MYDKHASDGKSKTVEVRAVFNSKKAKIMRRKIFKGSKPQKVKVVFTLKRRYFNGNSENAANTSETSESSGGTGDTRDENNFEEQFENKFQKPLKRLSGLDMGKQIEELCCGENEA